MCSAWTVVDGLGLRAPVGHVAQRDHQLGFGVVVVLGRTDNGHDLVDHVGGGPLGQQQVQAAAEHFELVLQPLGHHFFAKTEEADQDLAQRQGLGDVVHQDREVEGEGVA